VAGPKEGDRAPDFALPGTGGRTYRLSEYRGGNVILAFYPGDATTVCTKQFCSYRDQGERLDALDAAVLGISPQSVDSHEHWVKEQELNVPLLADEDLSVSKRYGVTGWIGPLARFAGLGDAPGGRYVMRAIFVIDGEGVVRHRTVSRTGANYESVEDLERAVAAIP
jgi:thioredoxin-dependent peroxiredoxin